MAIKQKTIEKYTEALKDVIWYIDEGSYKETPLASFLKANSLSANFCSAAAELGFISKNEGSKGDPIYMTYMKKEDVTPAHGRLVAEKLANINKGAYEKKRLKELKGFSDKQLMDELYERGYRGSLEMQITQTFTL